MSERIGMDIKSDREIREMSSTKKPLSEMDVLVVDDEADICTMVKYALQSLGVHKVHIAGNGRDAWNIYYDSKVRFDMIVSDWIMPEISGLDFLKRVRERNQNVPFVMLTSKGERDDVAAAAQNGVTGYIGKPFTLQGFQKHIRKIAGTAGYA